MPGSELSGRNLCLMNDSSQALRCKYCSKTLTLRGRTFCSQKCNAAFHNAKRKLPPAQCSFCLKEFEATSRSSKFCSLLCSAASRKPQTETDLKGRSSKECRNFLIAQFGAKCFDCGWDKTNPKTGKCPVELEHIDGDSSNNESGNLKLLCPNCHSLTPTYKSLNKGKGRFLRAQRYRDGKSY